MSDDRLPIAKVPVNHAVLFVAPDGADRDPDLNDPQDRAALQTISALEYLENWDRRRGAKAPNHRIYCPDCLKRGDLVRHKFNINHSRHFTLSDGTKAKMRVPQTFTRWPMAPQHHKDCDFARDLEDPGMHPHARITIEGEGEGERGDMECHNMTIPTGPEIRTDPPSRSRRQSLAMQEAESVRAGNGNDERRRGWITASIREIGELAALIRDTIFHTDTWNRQLIRDGRQLSRLSRIFFETPRDLFHHAHALAKGESQEPHAAVSFKPARHTGRNRHLTRFESERQTITGRDGVNYTLVVECVAKTTEAEKALSAIYAKEAKGTPSHLLVYGTPETDPAAFARERAAARHSPAHTPLVRITIPVFNPRQITDWTPPPRIGSLLDLMESPREKPVPPAPPAPPEARGRIKPLIRDEPDTPPPPGQ